MIKHVGKNGDRKVVIVFNEVPGEPHMCIAVYPDLLQRQMHDDLMKAIESVEGQNAENLGNALGSKYFSDGTVMLNRMHSENILKKIQTAQVILTPTPQSHVRLDEMNKILNEMKTGQEAVNRLQALENDKGYTGKAGRKDDMGRRIDDRGMDIGGPGANVPRPGELNESSHKGAVSAASIAASMAAPQTGALDDSSIANNLKLQADRMAAEAQGMLVESQRMQAEANAMLGVPAKPAAKKRGRPAKASA
jgi:hypothetical protein